MVREGQDALKREHMDCACLGPIGRWHLSQGGWVWEDRIRVCQRSNEGGWLCKRDVRFLKGGVRDVRVIKGGVRGMVEFFDFGLG